MKRVVVISGAGISAESGLKTFRGADGLPLTHGDGGEPRQRDSADCSEPCDAGARPDRRVDVILGGLGHIHERTADAEDQV